MTKNSPASQLLATNTQTVKLTDAGIRAMKDGERLFDTEVTGLHVRNRKTGPRFYLYYRTQSGTQRCPVLGQFPVLNCRKARDIALDMLYRVRLGEDPSASRQGLRAQPTVRELTEQYEDEVLINKKPSTAYDDRGRIRNYIIPLLGDLKVAEVEDTDIMRLHAKISMRAPISANRTVALISHMMTRAEKWKLRPRGSNPASGLDLNKERKRKFAMSPEECIRLGEALYEFDETDAEMWRVSPLIRLLLLTGARLKEIMHAEVDQFDVNNSRLIIPVNKEDNEDKTIPLSRAGFSIVKILADNTETQWLFPSTRRKNIPMKEPRYTWRKLRADAELNDKLRIHDLRHTFASAALRKGYTLEQIGSLLGHTHASTTEGYAYLTTDPRSEMMASIGDDIGELLFLEK